MIGSVSLAPDGTVPTRETESVWDTSLVITVLCVMEVGMVVDVMFTVTLTVDSGPVMIRGERFATKTKQVTIRE